MRPALHDSTDYECPFFKVVEKLVQEAGTARCLNPNHGAVFKNSPARHVRLEWMKTWHEVSALAVLSGTIPPEQSVHGSSERSPVREPLASDMGCSLAGHGERRLHPVALGIGPTERGFAAASAWVRPKGTRAGRACLGRGCSPVPRARRARGECAARSSGRARSPSAWWCRRARRCG